MSALEIVSAYDKIPTELLFSNQFKQIIDIECNFDIELVKYGKQFDTKAKRYAFVSLKSGLWSLKKSLVTAKNKDEVLKEAKEKNEILDEASLVCEEISQTKVNNKEWEIPTKNYRIVVGKANPLKKADKVELYFNTKDEVIIYLHFSKKKPAICYS